MSTTDQTKGTPRTDCSPASWDELGSLGDPDAGVVRVRRRGQEHFVTVWQEPGTDAPHETYPSDAALRVSCPGGELAIERPCESLDPLNVRDRLQTQLMREHLDHLDRAKLATAALVSQNIHSYQNDVRALLMICRQLVSNPETIRAADVLEAVEELDRSSVRRAAVRDLFKESGGVALNDVARLVEREGATITAPRTGTIAASAAQASVMISAARGYLRARRREDPEISVLPHTDGWLFCLGECPEGEGHGQWAELSQLALTIGEAIGMQHYGRTLVFGQSGDSGLAFTLPPA